MKLAHSLLKRAVVTLPIFGVFALLAANIPALESLRLEVTGWGWAVVLCCLLAFTAVRIYVKGFYTGLFGPHRFQLSEKSAAFMNQACDISGIMLGLIASSYICPSRVTCNSPFTLFVAGLLLSFAYACCELVYELVFEKR